MRWLRRTGACRRTRNPGRWIVLALGVAVAGCDGRGTAEGAGDSGGGADAKYLSEVDEGLGASVAILIDNSGSMEEAARGDRRAKYLVAREALETVLASMDSFVARRPDFPINVGLYRFATDVETLVPVKPYDRDVLVAALGRMPRPNGGTAIGAAMRAARADLYRAGTIRKYILVITDGENTDGPSPDDVAREIARRSEGAVRQYFVAFDIDAEKFGFAREVHGEVIGANNATALRAGLDTIYRGRILAEAVDAGETVPAARRDSVPPPDSTLLRPSSRPRNPTP